MFKLFVVPIIVAIVIGIAHPVVGVLAGILTALVFPYWIAWRAERILTKAIDRQQQFLDKYDVFSVSSANWEQLMLGTMTAGAEGVLLARKGIHAAQKTYPTKAAMLAQANAPAQFNLGVMYANGLGVPQDYVEALKWYRLAAAHGNATAQCMLGHMYHNGLGCRATIKVRLRDNQDETLSLGLR